MSEKFCTYPGDREATLIAYLYDEIEPAARRAFDAHVAICEACSTELSGLGATRARLDEWASPEPGVPLSGRIPVSTAERQLPGSRWRDLPLWMQTIAALLILGVSAGVANLHVTYNHDGLSIRTGWLNPVSGETAVVKPETAAVAIPAEPVATRAEVAKLEETLRGELRAASAGASPQQVRQLIADSERKQQNELALRIANLYKDTQVQRTSDMAKIDRYLNSWSSNTGLAVRRQDESIRSLQVRLAQAK